MDYNNKKKGEDRIQPEGGMSASRARNRTVMLTPELTGQVRSLLQNADVNKSSEAEEFSDNNENSDEFVSPLSAIGRSDTPTATMEIPQKRQNPAENYKPVSDTYSNDLFHKEKNQYDSGFTSPLKENKNELRESLHSESEENLGSRTGTLVTNRKAMGGDFGTNLNHSEVLSRQGRSNSSSNFNEERVLLAKETVSRRNKGGRIVGFLVTFDADEVGEVYQIRVGRWLVSSKKVDQEDLIIIEDNSVSPLHAVIKVNAAGEVRILDQLSEYGTGVIVQGNSSEEDASQGIVLLHHGDVVRFGKRYFVFCGVPKIQISE